MAKIDHPFKSAVSAYALNREQLPFTLFTSPFKLPVPLLANILLDDFDKELEARGLHFVRYADDFLVFVKSEVAAHRVFASIERYLTRTLKLVVNPEKSQVCRTAGVDEPYSTGEINHR